MNRLPKDVLNYLFSFLEWNEYIKMCDVIKQIIELPLHFKLKKSGYINTKLLYTGEGENLNACIKIHEYMHKHKITCEHCINSEELNNACKNGYFESIKYLHSIGNKFNKESINIACKIGNYQLIKYIHKHNVELITPSSMELLCAYGHLSILKDLYYVYGIPCTMACLYDALLSGHVDVLAFLDNIGIKMQTDQFNIEYKNKSQTKSRLRKIFKGRF